MLQAYEAMLGYMGAVTRSVRIFFWGVMIIIYMYPYPQACLGVECVMYTYAFTYACTDATRLNRPHPYQTPTTRNECTDAINRVLDAVVAAAPQEEGNGNGNAGIVDRVRLC